jgi:hypothetical protein
MAQHLKPIASGVSHTATPTGHSSEATALAAADASNLRRVQWTLPTISRTYQARDSTATIRYAQILYNHLWDQLRTEEELFKFSRIRTSIFERMDKDLTENDPWGPHSPGLIRAYNFVKTSAATLEQPNHDSAIDRFRQDRFSGVWADGGADIVLALCIVGDRPIRSLNEDLQVKM